MTSASTLDGTEITPIVQAGVNKQVTTANYVSQVLNVNAVTPTQGGTNIKTYALGDTLYASATNVLAKLSGNTTTTTKFLTQTGTGSASAAPSWNVIGPANINTQYGSFYFDFSTALTSAISNTDTTIPVTTTSGFSSVGAIIIGAELITYTGITATSFTGCTRGAAGSQSVSHAIGAPVNGAQVAVANTSTLLEFNTTTLSNGVTLNTSSQEISVAVSGTYNFAYSVQLNNSTAGQTLAALWFEIDGVKLSNSASWATIASRENATTPGSMIIAANFFITLLSSNKITMKWLTPDGHAALTTYPASASPSYPAAPAVILTVNQVS